MVETLRGVDPARLERSCRRDRIRFGTGVQGLERAEIFLSTWAYEPHRHDTYALGVTLSGVQRFCYRGASRVGLPGQLHVLHPDEEHDGAAGTEAGLRYRILYLAPELVRDGLGGDELPFVADPVQRASAVTEPVIALLRDLDDPVSDLGRAEAAAALADTLRALAGRRPDPRRRSTAARSRRRATTSPRTHASKLLRRRRSASPARTVSRSHGTSGAHSARAPTATGHIGGSRSPGRRSNTASRSPASPRARASQTKAT